MHWSAAAPAPRLDPRLRLALTFGLIIGTVSTPDRLWVVYAAIWLLLGLLARLDGIKVWRLAWMGGLALPFTLASVGLMFTTPGDSLWGLPITVPGLIRFGAIVIKSWLAVQFSALLILTTPFPDLIVALRCWRIPPRLVAILALTYRYLFTLREEAQNLWRARAARAVGSQRGLIPETRQAGAMIGNLLLRTYERSERIYAAMLARGYQGEKGGCPLPPLTGRQIMAGLWALMLMILLQTAAHFYQG